MYKDLIKKIDFNSNKEKTVDILNMLLCDVKEKNPELYKHIEGEMYIMACGKTINYSLADKWISILNPKGKWTKEQVSEVINTQGISIPVNCAYVIMNTAFSDYQSLLGDGNTPESLEKYIKYTKDFFYDEDYDGNGEEKTFNYGRYILKVI